LLVGCGSKQDYGLLALTLTADVQNPPAPAVTIELSEPGSLRRSYAAAFPPADGGSFLLEFPDLPAGAMSFTVQTLDGTGCVVGETPAAAVVTIKAGVKNTAQVTIQKSALACGDGGAPNVVGHDSGIVADGGSAAGVDVPVEAAPYNNADVSVGIVDAPVEVVVDLAASDAGGPGDVPSVDAASPSDRTNDVPVGSPDSQDSPGNQDSPPPAPPTITSFVASPATISAGSSATLTAIFAGASGSSVDHGIGSVSNGNGSGTGPLSSTTTYTLTVINSAGLSASAKATVTVVPLPVISSFAALMPTIACGTLTQLTATFTGGTASIDQGIGSVTSGAGIPTATLTANTTYTLTVTNPAGDSATKQATVTVSTAVGPGVFVATGSMAVTRNDPTYTLLPNGKVLVAGGDGGAGVPSTAELYDPSTGTFTPTGTMTTRRSDHTATLLQNGKVLVAGGIGLATIQASAEIYDPASGVFVTTGSMAAGRILHTATQLADGRVLVAGGESGVTGLATAELYDPSVGAFTSTGSMAVAREYSTASLLPSGRVLVAGGEDLRGTFPIYSSAELFDPGNGRFAATTSMSIQRLQHTATLLSTGQILIVGGGNQQTGVAASSEIYDETKGVFTVSGSMLSPRQYHAAALLPNRKVLVTGGASDSTVLSSAELFDPSAGSFTSTGDMTVPRQGHSAILLPSGRVLIVGGGLLTAETYY